MSRTDRGIRHVLLTADAVGGVWTFASDLSRALGERGVRVSLAVLGPSPSDAQREAVRRLPNVDLHEHAGRLEWMADPWDDVAAAGAWLLTLADALQPDIVHLNGLVHADLPWPAPVIVTGHSCVVSWWRAVHGSEPPAVWSRYVEEVSRSLRAADLVTAPTRTMLASLESDYGPFRAATVVANGRSSSPVSAAKEPFVFSAGRLWDEAKNVRAVCAAAPLVAWPTWVAGETTSPDGETVTCDGVHFLGRLEPAAVAQYMSRAAIYALPARYEPFGLSVLEAAQAGCALVLGDIRSLREVWADAAVYVPPDNRRMLAAFLQRLAEDERYRQEMAARALRRAGEMTAARMAEGYLEQYVVVRGPARPREASARPAELTLQAV